MIDKEKSAKFHKIYSADLKVEFPASQDANLDTLLVVSNTS